MICPKCNNGALVSSATILVILGVFLCCTIVGWPLGLLFFVIAPFVRKKYVCNKCHEKVSM